MSLFSFFRKNKQEASDDGASYSRAKDEPGPKRARARRNSATDDDAADAVLPEKKRARRRLIGAVALVLVAVIGLPMVLDSEPRPLAQDIDIAIPSKGQTASPRRVPAAASLDPAEQILEPVDAKPEPVKAASASGQHKTVLTDTGKPVSQVTAPKTATAEPKIAEPKAAEPKAAEPKIAEPKIAEAKPLTRTAPKEDSKAAAPATHKAEPKTPVAEDKDAARAMAILEGKANPDALKPQADKKPGRYMVQVAALTNQDKVNELRNKLKAAGIASQTQKVPTANGESTRVRVGPFASKDEAEKTRAKLVKLGLNGSLVPLGE